MLVYTINRILYLIPVLFILTIVVFSFVHFLPGDVMTFWLARRASLIRPYGRPWSRNTGSINPSIHSILSG